MSTATTQQVESKQIELVSRPSGRPTRDNFALRTVKVGPIEEGEILVRNHWMSVDPYMRGRMKDTDSYVPPFQIDEPLEGGCIGEVIQSRNPDFQEGDTVLGNLGWREYWVSGGENVTTVDPELAPVQAYLGALGMTGMTAWVGLHHIAKLQKGQTVFVSAASGAVGSIVCQLAKAMGCRVIGSAGKSEKIDWLKAKTGIDAVINYKEVDDLSQTLSEHAPDGVDVYFDNVGAEHLEAAIDNMNDNGVCVECGMIATYNATEAPSAPRNLFKVIAKRLRLEGFIVRDHMDAKDEFVSDMSGLIQDDKVVWEETVTEGIENAPDAFMGLFDGDNLGKQLVKIN
ncbi:NADP-dependent oxidoreductase [Rhodopirellula halodulae]|uniref:NADP-dependent oxidoreductase n=1 Tax=Rhodopirellula halodulae TaxID=2894198 RepID=UPI001E2D1AB4|nr:NADP-dependent oxidoreductase [Rhodopirellula sp. JC737]MCC9656164.1 NADP-dependent oxidoreductase [Rhodopirellula sp. JC737]